MSAFLADFFKKYEDDSLAEGGSYLAVVEYANGLKNFAYLAVHEGGDELETELQHLATPAFKGNHTEDFKVLKIASLDDINQHLKKQSFASLPVDEADWKDILPVLDDTQNAPHIGWGLVQLISPDVVVDAADDDTTRGWYTGDTYNTFVVAYMDYGKLDNEEAQGVEIEIFQDGNYQAQTITLENTPVEFSDASANKYIALDLDAILNTTAA